MKNEKKFRIAIVLFVLTFTALAFTASAESIAVQENVFAQEDGEIGITDNFESVTEDATSEGVEIESNNDEVTDEVQIFDEIYQEILKNADKIFAALAFVGTMLVSFAYKKGLIPLLKGAISALAGSVEKIKENGTELIKHTDNRFSSLCEDMHELVTKNAYLEKSVSNIDNRLDALDAVTEQYSSMKVIITSQIDMLYAIFMASAMPQYQKEEVCEKIKSMKEELAKYDKSEE